MRWCPPLRYYYCSCPNLDDDEEGCTTALGADAFNTFKCSEYATWMVDYDTTYCYDQANIYYSQDYVDICCSDGLNGCYGTCFSSASTVTRLAAGGAEEQVPLSALRVGDRVRVASKAKPGAKPGVSAAYDEVVALVHSPSAGAFLEVATASNDPTPVLHTLRVTPFHTVAVCAPVAEAFVPAAQLKVGTCVRTEQGHAKVTSVTPKAPAAGEDTFTVVLKGQTDMLAVDGVFTHAKPQHDNAKKADMAKKKSAGAARLRGGAQAAPPPSFQRAVTDVVDRKVKAAMAKSARLQAKA